MDEKINECWVEGKDYYALKSPSVPDHVYAELNRAYQLMYGVELDVRTREDGRLLIESEIELNEGVHTLKVKSIYSCFF